jgi:hypothetical protein
MLAKCADCFTNSSTHPKAHAHVVHQLLQYCLLTLDGLLQLHQAAVHGHNQPVEAHQLLAQHRIQRLMIVNRVPAAQQRQDTR